jgi:hypothetical protein
MNLDMKFTFTYESRDVYGMDMLFVTLRLNDETISTTSVFGTGNPVGNKNLAKYKAMSMKVKYMQYRDKAARFTLDYSKMGAAK